jgi:hypothetical protein
MVAPTDDFVPRPVVIPMHRLFFIIIEKEGHGKVMILYQEQWFLITGCFQP